MPLTAQGKSAALRGLRERRELYSSPDYKPVRNESLPAGSPMYFSCISCGAPIVMPEDWLTKPDCCGECSALLKLGWLEE
jgi:hypothetical protein